MGFRWTQGDVRRSSNKYASVAGAIDKLTAANLEVEGKKLEQKGQQIIGSSGTGRTWSRDWNGRSGSGEGRVDSGEMQKNFTYAVDKGVKLQRLRVGWVKVWEKYYGWQNEGFEWRRFGQSIGLFVEGMQVHLKMRGEVQAASRRAGKQIIRGALRYLRGK